MPLCILIAQQHENLLYGENSKHLHLKLLSQLVDQCQVRSLEISFVNRVRLGNIRSVWLISTSQHGPSAEQILAAYERTHRTRTLDVARCNAYLAGTISQ